MAVTDVWDADAWDADAWEYTAWGVNVIGQQIINHGSVAKDGTGEELFSVFDKVNDNFTELYEKNPVNVKLAGATGDGTTDDSAAIQAAIATGRSVFLPPATYRIANTLTLGNANQVMHGPGAKILVGNLSGLERAILVSGMNALLSSVEVDCNADNVTLNGTRGEGIRLIGDGATARNCYVHDCSPGGGAQCIHMAGKFALVDGCILENGGYAGVRLDATQNHVSNTIIRYTTERAGYIYRWFVGNNFDRVDLKNIRCDSTLSVETDMVLDVENLGLDRVVNIDGFTIDHAAYVPDSSNHQVKFEGIRKLSVRGWTANTGSSVSLRITNTASNEIETVHISDSFLDGSLHLGGTTPRSVLVEASEIKANSLEWFTASSVKHLRVVNSKLTGGTSTVRGFSSDVLDANSRIDFDDVTVENNNSGNNLFLFNNLSVANTRQIHMHNVKLVETSGSIYLASGAAERLLCQGTSDTKLLDVAQSVYYPGGSGTVGLGGGSAAKTNPTPASSGSAFTIGGFLGDRIINSNLGNGHGAGWIHDGTDWVPMDGFPLSGLTVAAQNTTVAALGRAKTFAFDNSLGGIDSTSRLRVELASLDRRMTPIRVIASQSHPGSNSSGNHAAIIKTFLVALNGSDAIMINDGNLLQSNTFVDGDCYIEAKGSGGAVYIYLDGKITGGARWDVVIEVAGNVSLQSAVIEAQP